MLVLLLKLMTWKIPRCSSATSGTIKRKRSEFVSSLKRWDIEHWTQILNTFTQTGKRIDKNTHRQTRHQHQCNDYQRPVSLAGWTSAKWAEAMLCTLGFTRWGGFHLIARISFQCKYLSSLHTRASPPVAFSSAASPQSPSSRITAPRRSCWPTCSRSQSCRWWWPRHPGRPLDPLPWSSHHLSTRILVELEVMEGRYVMVVTIKYDDDNNRGSMLTGCRKWPLCCSNWNPWLWQRGGRGIIRSE